MISPISSQRLLPCTFDADRNTVRNNDTVRNIVRNNDDVRNIVGNNDDVRNTDTARRVYKEAVLWPCSQLCYNGRLTL